MGLLIEYVDIKNFKRLTDVRHDFTEGLNTIHGPNFSGKTTIMEAVLYALYGPSVVPGNADNMANDKVGGKPCVTVGLSDGYTVKRSGSNAVLMKGKEEIARSASVVSSEMAKLFGLQKDQVMKTRVSEQNEAQVLLATGNTELKKLVEDLSGYSIINEVISLAKAYKKSGKGRVDALAEIFVGDDCIAELKKDRKVCRDAIVIQRAQLSVGLRTVKGASQTSENLRNSVKEAREFNSEMEGRIRMMNSLKGRKSAYQALLVGLLDELPEKEKARLPRVVEALSRNLVHARDIHGGWKRDMKANNADRSRLKKVAHDFSQSKEKLGLLDTVMDLDELQEAVDEFASEVSSLETEICKVAEALRNGECSTCRRPFETGFSKEALEGDLAGLEVRHTDAETRYHIAFGKSVRQKDLVFKRGVLEARIDAAEQGIASINASIAEFNESYADYDGLDAAENIEAMETRLTETREELSDAESVSKQRKNTVHELDNTEQAIKAQAKLISALKPVDQIERLYRVAVEANHRAELQLEADKAELQGSEKSLSRFEEQLEVATATKVKLKEAEKDLLIYSKLDKTIGASRAELMQSVWTGILQEASDFVSSVTDGYVSGVGVDDGFSVTYTEDGKTFPILSASGSQKSLISLGIRMGIGNMLPSKVGFFIMDEVSAAMEDSVAMMAMSVAKSKCQQIIAVSHRPADMVTSDNLIQTER